ESIADNLGYSVSVVGDVNGDGYDDVLVGAPNYSIGAVNRGRAYLYLGGAVIGTTPALTLTGENAFDFFGHAVADAGDLNHDGFGDFVVTAHGYGNNRGRVY